jgi:hypothetical protein
MPCFPENSSLTTSGAVPAAHRDASSGIKSFCVFFSRKRRFLFFAKKKQKTCVPGVGQEDTGLAG